MKLTTIERKIRYTTIPYPDIYRKAEKSLRVEYKEDSNSITATAFDKLGHFARSCWYKNDIEHAIFNEYSYPRQ